MSVLTSQLLVCVAVGLNMLFGLICLGTIASVLTAVDPVAPYNWTIRKDAIFQGSWFIGGRSAPVFLFFTASAALLQDILHALVGLDALKTRFMVLLQGTLAIFYLSASVASLALVSDPHSVLTGGQKNINVAAASFGVLSSLSHGVTAFLSLQHYLM